MTPQHVAAGTSTNRGFEALETQTKILPLVGYISAGISVMIPGGGRGAAVTSKLRQTGGTTLVRFEQQTRRYRCRRASNSLQPSPSSVSLLRATIHRKKNSLSLIPSPSRLNRLSPVNTNNRASGSAVGWIPVTLMQAIWPAHLKREAAPC